MIWLLYLPLTTIVCLLAFPLAPIIALFANGQGDVTLSYKNPLRLWLTPDNPIEGDSGHFERWANFVAEHPKIGMYVQRVAWLWRNKAYGWRWTVFSTFVAADDELLQYGDSETDNDPYHPGVWFATTSRNPVKARWMLYVICPTFSGRCLRVYLGWKLQSACKYRIQHADNPEFVVPDYTAMFVCSVNPWREIE